MLNLVNLNVEIRELMLSELASDLARNVAYLSPRLTEEGKARYPALLEEAVAHHDDDWLATQLRDARLMETHESRRKPTGGYTMVKVPVTAAETLAEGEFNRYYIRGVCRAAIGRGIPNVVVYRAKRVENARPESSRRLGAEIPATQLLDDLRRCSPAEVETSLGVPAGPNSGLSVQLPATM